MSEESGKRGPKPRTGEVAARMLRVRCTDDEWAELERRAAKEGRRLRLGRELSLSEYVRLKALDIPPTDK
jgi:hypothetical protein